MDSDEVNSINDTTESQQVALLVRTAYLDMKNRANLPEHHSLITLDASGDANKPVIMYLPNTVQNMTWLKYNICSLNDPEINMRTLEFLPLKEYLDLMYQLNTEEDDVESFQHTIGSDVFTILYKNNNAPEFYTTFDDFTVLFNSYDSGVDTTLQKSKTLAAATMIIPFSMEDSFIPDLDDAQFALLLNEAKSLAWAELKQTQNPKAEQSARRGWVNLQRSKKAIKTESDFMQLPNFGRK